MRLEGRRRSQGMTESVLRHVPFQPKCGIYYINLFADAWPQFSTLLHILTS